MAFKLNRVARLASVATIALAGAAMPAAAQDSPYSGTIFFGDSLTDAGFFRPLLPVDAQPITGQFTTNPGSTYAQLIADFYGGDRTANGNGQTGDNYAVGGARINIDYAGALGPIPSLQTQVNNYLASTGGAADPNALYTVFGGANDLFVITNNAGNPATIIPSAVAGEVGIVSQLTSAGARYILVPNIPDLGVTPGFRAQGPAAQAGGTAVAVSYNDALYAGLNSAGLRYIPLNNFALINEVVSNPNLYGFTNVTGTACQPQITANSLLCNPTSYVSPTAPEDYVFADGVHPTTGAHRLFANYALSILEGPRQIALMPYVTSLATRGKIDRVALHAGRPTADGMGLWVEGSYDGQNLNVGNGYDGKVKSVMAGFDWTSGGMRAGAFIGAGWADYNFDFQGGGFSQDDLMIGGYAGWYGSNFWARGTIGYSFLKHDIDRDVVLGAAVRRHSGEADGGNLFGAIQGGYDFRSDEFTHGPVVGLVAQRVRIDGFAEDQPTLSTALAFPDQDFNSLVGSIGYRAEMNLSSNVKPYIQLTYDKEFGDLDDEAYAQLLSMPGTTPYAVPGLGFDDDYVTGQLGLKGQFGNVSAHVGGNFTALNDDGNIWGVRAGLGVKF